jgi:hypothetical protein
VVGKDKKIRGKWFIRFNNSLFKNSFKIQERPKVRSLFFINISTTNYLTEKDMALWGNNDNVGSGGTVTLSLVGSNWIVTGSGTTFGQVGAAKTGDVIRFGVRGGTYYGDAVIVGIASTTQLTINSVSGLSTTSIAGTDFYVSELPIYTVGDSTYSEAAYGTNDKLVYGISTSSQYVAIGYSGFAHQGWVGVTTYIDMHGNLRVKTETLVAMSGITTGSDGISYPTPV